ncbi:MAG TPA: hypothetical protein VNW46_09780, partial [Gemmatimonadaceae bacterium]|nr:hypothetical protein [Gemmatimonadaceae bacterium]
PTPTPTPTPPPPRQWIEVRNVDLRLNDAITLRIRAIHGEIVRTTPDRPAALDDPTSFRINVSAGTVALTGDDVAALLNTVILAYAGSPLTDVTVHLAGDHLIAIGALHTGGTSHRVELTGTVDVTPDSRIRLHVLRAHVLGINGEQLLHTLGLHLDDVVHLTGARGATIKGDDIFLDPLPFLPPPSIAGHLAAVHIDGDRLVEDFATTDDDAAFQHAVRADTSGNFIYVKGGDLRFGRLLMRDTDVRMYGGDGATPFDLDLPHYTRQLVAGYSRTRADSGLIVYMPNVASLATAQR